MIDKTKKEIQNAKCRAIIWTIAAVLLIIIPISLVAMLGTILDIPGWARAVVGVLLYGAGQAMFISMLLASYEFSYIKKLEKYLTELEELDNEITKL